MTEAAPSRTAHYLQRLEAKLATLSSNAARAAFVAEERAKWDERFRRFEATAGEAFPGANAFDFAETIAALGTVAARYERAAA